MYSYDKHGKIKNVEDIDLGYTLYSCEYDSFNRPVKETDTRGTYTVYCYDENSRYTSVLTYAADGTLLSEKYLAYDETYIDVDGTPRMQLTLSEGAGEEKRKTEYIFDRKEQLLEQKQLSQSGDRIYRFSYDNAGNSILAVSPFGGDTEAVYDIL